jgi:hypothetical protein
MIEENLTDLKMRNEHQMNIPNHPVVTSEILIRKPVGEVFEAMVNPDITTIVRVTEKGFWNESPEETENLNEIISLMLGQKGGWTLVLASMKAWLEHELDLNLIADHKPD